MRHARPVAITVLLAALALAASGCLSAGNANLGLANTDGVAEAVFNFEATNCGEGGFLATYSGTTTYAGVWTSADNRGEFGIGLAGSPASVALPQYGNIHFGIQCATATFDGQTIENFQWGWVGAMVEAPAWDPGGADLHYLISGMGFPDGTVRDTLRTLSMADFTQAAYACTYWGLDPALMPGEVSTCPNTAPMFDLARGQTLAYAYSAYDDVQKGLYQAWSPLTKFRDVPERTVRFWWEVPADGSRAVIWQHHDAEPQPEGLKWHPVYFDMHTTGGEEWTDPYGIGGVGEHNMAIPVGEHGAPFSQPNSKAYYEHKSLSFRQGPVLTGVTLDEVWAH